MGRRHLALVALSSALVLVAVVPSAAQRGAPRPPSTREAAITWKLQTAWRSSWLYHQAALRFAVAVDEATDGRIRIDVVPAATTVPSFEVLDAVGRGTLDMALGWAGFWGMPVPAAQVLGGFPFGPSAEKLKTWLLREGGLEIARSAYASRNVVPLVVATIDREFAGWLRRDLFDHGHVRGFAIVGVTASGPLFYKLLPRVGAVARTRAATVQPDGIAATEPYHDVLTGLHQLPGVAYFRPAAWTPPSWAVELLVNASLYEGLSPGSREMLAREAARAGDWLASEMARRTLATLGELQRLGIPIRTLPEPLVTELRDATVALLTEEARKDPYLALAWESLKRAGGAPR